MNATTKQLNPYAIWLTLAGAASIILAGVLGLGAIGAADDYPANPALIAGLNAWSNLLILVGITAFIGGAVLGGVRWLLADTR